MSASIDLQAIRRELHMYPELSGMERNTALTIIKYLRILRPSEIVEGLGGQGLAAIFQFSTAGPIILLRAELDALPIDESSGLSGHSSTVEGISHKCGHDGHMTILLGVARFLSTANYQQGKVILLFQPAEETGEGAKSILKDPKFETIQPDYVFALHNLPGFEKNTILTKPGTFTAAVCSLIVRCKGVSTHASEPEKGKNPSAAMAKIALRAHELTSNLPHEETFRLITPVYTQMGQKAYGMSAGEGEMHFTLRAWTSENLDRLMNEFMAQIEEIAAFYQLEVTFELLENFASTHNDPRAVEIISEAASKNQLLFEELKSPFKFGEDFGLFTQKFPGAMFGIGAGLKHPPLHHKNYDFPDELIDTGVAMFEKILDLFLTASAG